MAKNYTSNIDIKNLMMQDIAPKYFDVSDISELNVGLLGYINDVIGTISEDSFNTTTAYMNEIFPHLAVLPETIYNNASLFKIDGFFGTPAVCKIYIFIPEEDVIRYATRVSQSSNVFEFFIDSSMSIDIENHRFKPDYNIRISYKKYKNDYIFTAMYDMTLHGGSYSNTLSDISNPYIKLTRINYENTKYLQLELLARQVDSYFIEELVINGGILNLPTYDIDFDDYMANFEIFYKEPGKSTFVQIKKLLIGTTPIKAPFCYYNMVDSNRLEITFTSRDGYFQPEYNSEFRIDYYLTTGKSGNFTSYSGNNIIVTPSSEVYDYNNNLTIFAIPINGSTGGKDPLSLEQLKLSTVEMFSTGGSYTNENDLQLYFDSINTSTNTKLFFIKKRDDIFRRTFASFLLLKDSNDEFINTNTLRLKLKTTDFDGEHDQSNIFILKPGHIFKYVSDTTDMIECVDNVSLVDHASVNEPFIFTNPFLIYFSKNPAAIGYYNTSVNSTHSVDYISVNDESLVQFICNNLRVTRNAHLGESSYRIRLSLTPTITLDNPMVIVDESTGTSTITNSISVRMYLTNGGVEESYIEMTLSEYDLDLNAYAFTADISTDDYITLSNKFRVFDMYDAYTDQMGSQFLVDMKDSIIKFRTYYKYANTTTYVHTNVYSTESNPVDFISPLNMVDSTVSYHNNMDGIIDPDSGVAMNNTYHITIDSSPVVRASTMVNKETSQEFYTSFLEQYRYANNILSLIHNNFTIDIKFYNTYGKSHNFYVGDELETRLDRVNIEISFKVNPVFGSDYDELVRDLSIFIKDYVESINNSGTNSIYISNLIREIENNFDSVSHLKFVSFNDYNCDIQSIENTTVDLSKLTIEQRKAYVPEYLTLALTDVNIELI